MEEPGGCGERDASLGMTALRRSWRLWWRVQGAVLLGISVGDERYSWETDHQGPRISFQVNA